MILYPKPGQLFLAGLAQTALANAVLHLVASNLNLNQDTPLADLVAAEANYSGYAAKTITTFSDPFFAVGGGATISSPYLQFEFVPPVPPALPVANTIYMFYLLDSTGKLVVAGTLDQPTVMQELGDALPITLQLNFGKTA
jgi:hypothetical protein